MLYTSALCEFQHLQMQIQFIYHGKTIHEQCHNDLRYYAVALLKVQLTIHEHSATEMYNNYTDQILRHLRTAQMK